MTNFDILYMTKPSDLDYMGEWYHKDSYSLGFSGVYTKDGYDLARAITGGQYWYEWFLMVRGLGAVRYGHKTSCYSQDYATVLECDLVAYDKAGKMLATRQIASEYIGASESDKEEQEKAWRAGIGDDFSEIIENVKTFLRWQGSKQAKGL